MLLDTCLLLAGHSRNFYPSLLHVTCVAPLAGTNCAMRSACLLQKTSIAVVATVKAATIKNKETCYKDFHEAGLWSPLEPVVTRWATWLRAAFYYSEHLPVVCAIVNNWVEGGNFSQLSKGSYKQRSVWCQTWSFFHTTSLLQITWSSWKQMTAPLQKYTNSWKICSFRMDPAQFKFTSSNG